MGELNGLFHPSHDCSSKIARVGALNMSLQVESLVSVQWSICIHVELVGRRGRILECHTNVVSMQLLKHLIEAQFKKFPGLNFINKTVFG